MKIAMVVGIAVVLLIGGIWIVGGRERSYHAVTSIRATPEQVFPWLVEPARLSRWIEGFVESRPLGDGVLRVGARSIDVVGEDGQRVEMTTEVLALETGRLLEVSLESPFMAGTNRFALSPSPEGTLLTQTLTGRLRGMARLFGPFMGGTVQRKLDGDLARLRSAVESGAAR